MQGMVQSPKMRKADLDFIFSHLFHSMMHPGQLWPCGEQER